MAEDILMRDMKVKIAEVKKLIDELRQLAEQARAEALARPPLPPR